MDCIWPVVYPPCPGDVDGDLPAPLNEWEEPEVLRVEKMAADFLRTWAGPLGLCPVTVRPCLSNYNERPSTFAGRSGYQFMPVSVRGSWRSLSCGSCGSVCGCDDTTSLRLPGPIAEISHVSIDGVKLPSTSYRLDNRTTLVRQDGESWPTRQDMSLGQEDVGAWYVEYLMGSPVPEGGQIAAGLLAVEFAKALCKDKSCQLPTRLQSITRAGVTMAILDSFDDLDKGHTGIWLVDSWVSSMNNRPHQSSVMSPDIRKKGHRWLNQ